LTLEPRQGQLRILVVDDHAISARHAVAVLSRSAGEVRWSNTASGALELTMSWHPHLIFMDLHLHRANGLDLLGRIREQWPADRPEPKIIVLTADKSVQAGRDFAAFRVDHLLLKPVSGQQLRKAAGLGLTLEINESQSADSGASLPALFRDELEQRLPELDFCLSVPERKKACAILHQLIASAAMCGETRLESALRTLDKMCRQDEMSGEVAVCYHAFLETAQEFIAREAPR